MVWSVDQSQILVDLIGWNRVSLSNSVNNKASLIIRDRQLQPRSLSETGEVSSEILQVKLSRDDFSDYWTITNQWIFFWHPCGTKFDYRQKRMITTYCVLAYIQHLPTADRQVNWGMNVKTQCLLCNNHNETHAHLFMQCNYNTYLWDKLFRKLDLQ